MPTQLRKMFQKVVNMAPKWDHVGLKNRLEIQKNVSEETFKKRSRKSSKKDRNKTTQGTKIRPRVAASRRLPLYTPPI